MVRCPWPDLPGATIDPGSATTVMDPERLWVDIFQAADPSGNGRCWWCHRTLSALFPRPRHNLLTLFPSRRRRRRHHRGRTIVDKPPTSPASPSDGATGTEEAGGGGEVADDSHVAAGPSRTSTAGLQIAGFSLVLEAVSLNWTLLQSRAERATEGFGGGGGGNGGGEPTAVVIDPSACNDILLDLLTRVVSDRPILQKLIRSGPFLVVLVESMFVCADLLEGDTRQGPTRTRLTTESLLDANLKDNYVRRPSAASSDSSHRLSVYRRISSVSAGKRSSANMLDPDSALDPMLFCGEDGMRILDLITLIMTHALREPAYHDGGAGGEGGPSGVGAGTGGGSGGGGGGGSGSGVKAAGAGGRGTVLGAASMLEVLFLAFPEKASDLQILRYQVNLG